MARFNRDKAVTAANGQFNLIMLAAKRAKDLQKGAPALTDNPGNGAGVTALREIEEGLVTLDYMEQPAYDPRLYADDQNI